MPIERRIIQTGKSRTKLSRLAKAVVANVRLLNPDFEYLFFDDADVEAFIDSEFPQHRRVYDGFPVRIQRYDFFRYLAVYRLGGFYFDLDVVLGEGLEPLRRFECVFPFEEVTVQHFLRRRYAMDWEAGNYAFGASAGHPFLEAIISNCIRAQDDPAWVNAMMQPIPRMFRPNFAVLNTTGPGLVSRTLAEYRDPVHPVHVLFPADVCDETNWHCFGDYGIHLQEGTWRSHEGLIPRRLSRFWEVRTRDALMRESRAMGPRRSLDTLFNTGVDVVEMPPESRPTSAA
jgi:mannosyltransferase OCH1-like enzyme